jgi:hypothetical protein
MNMGFDTEPTGYRKTILPDLQGTWQCLRQEVAENPGFGGWARALFHIDEAMRWESVRNTLQQADVPDGVTECLDEVSALMSIIWSSR